MWGKQALKLLFGVEIGTVFLETILSLSFKMQNAHTFDLGNDA